jgi:hypothetical protein
MTARRANAIIEYVVTGHAAYQMNRRNITLEQVRCVLDGPEQRFAVGEGRDVLQSRLRSEGRLYLVRVFVDVDRKPAEVITAYRTSRIEKYWRQIA